jgi:hypothetical protein
LNQFGLLVLEKRIFKNLQCIFTLAIISPWRGTIRFISPTPKDDVCQVWLKFVGGSGEEVENVKVRRTTDNGRSE